MLYISEEVVKEGIYGVTILFIVVIDQSVFKMCCIFLKKSLKRDDMVTSQVYDCFRSPPIVPLFATMSLLPGI